MNVRAQAVGMSSQCQNISNLIFQQCFPQFLDKAGWRTFFFFAGINLLLAAFVYIMIPETRKVGLEEVDALFGSVNHKEKGVELIEHDADRTGSIDKAARAEIKEA